MKHRPYSSLLCYICASIEVYTVCKPEQSVLCSVCSDVWSSPFCCREPPGLSLCLYAGRYFCVVAYWCIHAELKLAVSMEFLYF